MNGQIDDATFRVTAEEQLSTAVVRAVATAEGTDPTDLETPLHDVIDPDALDRLFQPGTFGRVDFIYYDYEVSVYDDGRVILDER